MRRKMDFSPERNPWCWDFTRRGFCPPSPLSLLLPDMAHTTPLTAFSGPHSLPKTPLWKPLTEPHSTMIYDQVTGWCSMVVTAERSRGCFWPGRQPGDRWWRSERRSVTKAEVGAAALLPPMSTCLVCLLPPVPTCPADTCTTAAAGPVCTTDGASWCDNWCNMLKVYGGQDQSTELKQCLPARQTHCTTTLVLFLVQYMVQ